MTAVAQLVDLKVGLTKDDETMLAFLGEIGMPHFVVCTKADKPNKTDRKKQLDKILESPYVAKAQGVVLFSSLSGEGKEEVIKMILDSLD